MVKVYFETPKGSYAELVAILDSEETYDICFDALEKEAKKHGMIVTEGVDEETKISQLKR